MNSPTGVAEQCLNVIQTVIMYSRPARPYNGTGTRIQVAEDGDPTPIHNTRDPCRYVSMPTTGQRARAHKVGEGWQDDPSAQATIRFGPHA